MSENDTTNRFAWEPGDIEWVDEGSKGDVNGAVAKLQASQGLSEKDARARVMALLKQRGQK